MFLCFYEACVFMKLAFHKWMKKGILQIERDDKFFFAQSRSDLCKHHILWIVYAWKINIRKIVITNIKT